MYQLLSLLDDSHLDIMIRELEEHMTQTGLTIVQSLESEDGSDNVSRRFLHQKSLFNIDFRYVLQSATFRSKVTEV